MLRNIIFPCMAACVAPALVTLSLATIPSASAAQSINRPQPQSSTLRQGGAVAQYGAGLPLLFVENLGQWHPILRYAVRTERGGALFTKEFIELQERSGVHGTGLRLRPMNAQAAVTLVPGKPSATKFNFFRGKNSANWHTGIPTFADLSYQGIYPSTDLVFRDRSGQLAYDFVLAPGADPADIRMAVEGAESLTLDDAGAMIMTLSSGREIRQAPPVIYQEKDGKRQAIKGHFRILSERENDAPAYGFALGNYNPNLALIIDPTISYSSFVGGTGDDLVRTMVTNADGETYVAGGTESTLFPDTSLTTSAPTTSTIITPWDFPTVPGTQASSDGFIYKFNNSGTSLEFVTILAGDGDDWINGLVLDDTGNLYVTGYTESTNFATRSALYPVLADGSADAFIAKLNATGDTLYFSTYFGGTDDESGNAIALDQAAIDGSSAGNIYIAGTTGSEDMVLRNPLYAELSGSDDGFLARFTLDGSALRYSTYFGGRSTDSINVLEVSATGDLFFAGNTQSTNTTFPSKHGFQSNRAGSSDMFVARIARGGGELVFSTYLGGSGNDILTDMVRDAEGNYLISGYTTSTNFPVVNALQETRAGGTEATLTKLDKSGRFTHFSTYLGALNDDFAYAVAVDQAPDSGTGLRYIYLGGQSDSHFFTTQNPIQNYHAGEGDGFIIKTDPCGQVIYFSTYFGGLFADSVRELETRPVTGTREVFLSGQTEDELDDAGETLFPLQPSSAYQTENAGGIDTFSAHIIDIDNDRTNNFDPEIIVGCNPDPYPPERVCANCGGARLPLLLNDPNNIGISGFSTTIKYDPDELQLQEIQWANTLPLSATKLFDNTTPGEVRLDVYQPIGAIGFQRLDYQNALMATLDFSVVDVGTIRDNPPLPSKQIRITQESGTAADLNALDTFISGQPGAIFIERRCNSLIGDCDCSGQVQIFEVQSGVDYYTRSLPENQPYCVKRDYSVMATTDLQEIINNYNGRIIESSVQSSIRSQATTPVISAAILDQTSRLDFSTPQVNTNGQIEYDLELDTNGQSIAVLATDVFYDPDIVTAIDVTAMDATQNANKQVAFAIVQRGWLRITFYGLNATTFPSGTVASINITLAPSATCSSLHLTQQPAASTPFAEAVPIEGNEIATCDPQDVGPDRSSLAWQVTEVYIATMGYAPDNQGLQYWVDRILTDTTWTQETVAQSFFDQPLVQAQYTGLTNSQFVDQLYLNIFDRSADSGAAYWLSQLNYGGLLRNQVIIAMINGGYANPAAVTDMARFSNLIEVGLAFAARQEDLNLVYSQMPPSAQVELRSKGLQILYGVTDDPATRDAAIASIPFLLPN